MTGSAAEYDHEVHDGTTTRRVMPPNDNNNNPDTWWSGLETVGMKEAKCSLLIQEEADYDARIKALPKQTVTVFKDKGMDQQRVPPHRQDKASDPEYQHYHRSDPASDDDSYGDEPDTSHLDASSSYGTKNTTSFSVDFTGATILQLEPVVDASRPQHTMPVTLTVGGRCLFTAENYQDFHVMMRSKAQAATMMLAPNGTFDWPDVQSLLLCPVCGTCHPEPVAGDRRDHEYWMLFYPLLQVSVTQQNHMTLSTRTICRLTCLECMDDLLEGLSLQIRPTNSDKTKKDATVSNKSRQQRLCFTLPATDVLAEAGSASFLEDGPPRPETHPQIDDILDAWTLYNLWEQSGAWEALQNDYRSVLSKSMQTASQNEPATITQAIQPRLKERMGRPCGNVSCHKVHGKPYSNNALGESQICRLVYKCRDCTKAYYCSKTCRAQAKADHAEQCKLHQAERAERREKRAKKVQCDTCQKHFPYTKMKKCSRCRKATYCSVDCQRLDWQRHRDVCC